VQEFSAAIGFRLNARLRFHQYTKQHIFFNTNNVIYHVSSGDFSRLEILNGEEPCRI